MKTLFKIFNLSIALLLFFSFDIYSQSWVRSASTSEAKGFVIKTDVLGNVYTAGEENRSTSTVGAFFSKHDVNGNLVWKRSLVGIPYCVIYGLEIDTLNNIAVTGGFSGTIDFDAGGNVSNLTNGGARNTFIAKYTSSGNLMWVKRAGHVNPVIPNTSSRCEGTSLDIDDKNNIYVLGNFTASADFSLGQGAPSTFFNSNGNEDLYILKVNSSTTSVKWARHIGGAEIEYPSCIHAGPTGNIFITGSFNGTVDFDPNAGVVNLTAVGGYNGFVSKLDSLGNIIWAKQLGNSSTVGNINSVCEDGSGNVYITGTMSASIDLNPGSGVNNFNTNGFEDAFVVKLDANGNYVWAKTFGSTLTDYGLSIVATPDGNIAITGTYSATVDFNPGPGVNNLVSAGNYDIYVLKLDANGNFIDVSSHGATGNDFSSFISTDANSDLYVAGNLFSAANFNINNTTVVVDPGSSRDAFALKLDLCDIPTNVTLSGSTLSANATGVSYQWVNCSNGIVPIAGATNSTFTPSTNGNYAVQLSNGICNSISPCVSVNVVSLEENNLNSLRVYPNPSNEKVSIELGNKEINTIIIYSAIGQKLNEVNVPQNMSKIDITLPLEKGVYFIEGRDKNGQVDCIKVIKNN
jgi:hypothetical protein